MRKHQVIAQQYKKTVSLANHCLIPVWELSLLCIRPLPLPVHAYLLSQVTELSLWNSIHLFQQGFFHQTHKGAGNIRNPSVPAFLGGVSSGFMTVELPAGAGSALSGAASRRRRLYSAVDSW